MTKLQIWTSLEDSSLDIYITVLAVSIIPDLLFLFLSGCPEF